MDLRSSAVVSSQPCDGLGNVVTAGTRHGVLVDSPRHLPRSQGVCASVVRALGLLAQGRVSIGCLLASSREKQAAAHLQDAARPVPLTPRLIRQRPCHESRVVPARTGQLMSCGVTQMQCLPLWLENCMT